MNTPELPLQGIQNSNILSFYSCSMHLPGLLSKVYLLIFRKRFKDFVSLPPPPPPKNYPS